MEIHLLTLIETWLKQDTSDGEYDIPGYRLYRKDRDGNNSGVAVYAREDLFVTRRKDLEIDCSLEALWLEIAVPKVLILSIDTTVPHAS